MDNKEQQIQEINDRELRFKADAMEVIQRSEGEEQKTYFTGKAIVFGQWQELYRNFFEKVEADALTNADMSDTKVNFDHRNGLTLLGRTSSGTAKIFVSSDGVSFEVSKPNTAAANDLQEMISRGDVNGCSFHASFNYSEGDYVIRQEGEKTYATLKRVRVLKDVAIVVDPAYKGTSVSAIKRSIEGLVLPKKKTLKEGQRRVLLIE